MQTSLIFSILIWNIFKARGEQMTCRTNCSVNGTKDDQCWQEALVYRSSELVQRLFQFSSLSIYLDSYQRFHNNSDELNDTTNFLDQSLTNHLVNESLRAQVNLSLFLRTKDRLLQLCRNLTSTPEVTPIRQLPSLACRSSTCRSERVNYMVLFTISVLLSCLVFVVCVVQSVKAHRRSTSMQKTHLLLQHSLSTTNTSVNS